MVHNRSLNDETNRRIGNLYIFIKVPQYYRIVQQLNNFSLY